ncbi:MAG: hypothetical protein WBA05_09020 [Gordonia sp. (in: high G+C Gram-positive bacteria)]|uniref:hypothetical protein n=1 Tax=Gordonia sp. (in: high G+C Gram-positive bacteria) TaxID=84139 RepID=UPI003C70BB89
MATSSTILRPSRKNSKRADRYDFLSVSWVDSTGREHSRRASRRLRTAVPADAEIWPTARLNPTLFAQSSASPSTRLLDGVLQCDRDVHPTDIAVCTVVISCDAEAHVVPIFVTGSSGDPLLVELSDTHLPVFVRVAAAIIGWRVVMLPELSGVERRNLRMVKGARDAVRTSPVDVARVLSAAESPMSIGDLCQSVDCEGPEQAIPIVGDLLWRGRLTADWTQLFTLDTIVTRHVAAVPGRA